MTSETREKINRASIIIDNAMYCDEDKSLRVIGRLYYDGKEYVSSRQKKSQIRWILKRRKHA